MALTAQDKCLARPLPAAQPSACPLVQHSLCSGNIPTSFMPWPHGAVLSVVSPVPRLSPGEAVPHPGPCQLLRLCPSSLSVYGLWPRVLAASPVFTLPLPLVPEGSFSRSMANQSKVCTSHPPLQLGVATGPSSPRRRKGKAFPFLLPPQVQSSWGTLRVEATHWDTGAE